jgi:hypothetical protein
MKKGVLLLIVLLVIGNGFLSGCNQINNKPPEIDLTKVELVNYTLRSRIDMLGEEYKQINGFVRNNAGITIESMEIEAKFYGINNTYIISKFGYISNLANKDAGEFQIVYHSVNDYYYLVDWDNYNNIQLHINTSKIKILE